VRNSRPTCFLIRMLFQRPAYLCNTSGSQSDAYTCLCFYFACSTEFCLLAVFLNSFPSQEKLAHSYLFHHVISKDCFIVIFFPCYQLTCRRHFLLSPWILQLTEIL
jgi:hypothetical protein